MDDKKHLPAVIAGAGGGGGKGGGNRPGHVAIEDPDTLRSKAYARVLDLISEGEIFGLVDGFKSIFLDDTPIQNADGSFNFQNVAIATRTGTQAQAYIDGFPQTENTIAVSAAVTQAAPLTRTISNANANYAIVTIGVNALIQQDPSTGDTHGTSVSIAIDLQSNGGGFVQVSQEDFVGKTISHYQRSTRFALTGSPPWDIRVRRLTADSTSGALINATTWDSYVEGVSTKFTFPNSAMVGLSIDAEQFQTIPRRSFLVKGILVKIPSNYDPITRKYTGNWDGTFVVGWTNNPAWCWYDMVTNTRYGLGKYVDPTLADKWSLFTIAQYCDGLVPAGLPGWALNLVGGTSKAQITNNASLNTGTGDFTVEAFVQTTSTADNRNLITKNWSSTGGWGFGIDAAGHPYYLWSDAAGHYFEDKVSNTLVNDGNVHHVCIVYQHGVAVTGYVDGVPGLTLPRTDLTGTADNSQPLVIGNTFGGYTGTVDGVRIYMRALSAAEIAEHATQVYSSASGNALSLDFEEGSGVTALDASGNANNATLSNGAGYVGSAQGAVEPRFSCNLYLQTQSDAITVIQAMASIFRGMVYWSAGQLTPTQDAPGSAVHLFSSANTRDGLFTYSGSSRRQRHTVALVSYNDPLDHYRQKVEYVPDRLGIARYGVVESTLVAVGCTSRSQANRAGRWLLFTERLETETVTFQTALEGYSVRPGQLFKVADPDRAGKRIGGRTPSASNGLSSSLAFDFTKSSLTPTTGSSTVAVTRSTTATRVNASGLIEVVVPNVPRFDFDPVTLQPKGLLIEETRTNVALRSAELDNGVYGLVLGATVTPNTTIAPDGTLSADTVNFSGTDGNRIEQSPVAAVAAATWTYSVYLSGTGSININVGTSTGVGGQTEATITLTPTLTKYQVTVVLNGAPTGNVRSMIIHRNASNTATQCVAWGWSLENAAAASSYIPTTSAAVTRNADLVVPSLGSWFNATEGTFVVEYIDQNVPSAARTRWCIDGPSSYMVDYGTANEQVDVVAASVLQAGLNAGAVANGAGRSAFAYKANDFSLSLNGGATSVDSSGTVASFTRFTLGAFQAGPNAFLNGWITRFTYYPSRISNADLLILSGTGAQVTLDSPLIVQSGKSYSIDLKLPDGSVETRTITNAPGTYSVVSLDRAFSQTPQPYANWVISVSDLQPQLFRCIVASIKDDTYVEVTGLESVQSKFAAVETGVQLEPLKISTIKVTPGDPSGLTLTDYIRITGSGDLQTVLSLGWTPPADVSTGVRYVIEYRKDNGNWTQDNRDPVSTPSYDILGVSDASVYEVRVWSVNIAGTRSNNFTTATRTVVGKLAPPSDVATMSVAQQGNLMMFIVSTVEDPDLDLIEIRFGETTNTWDQASPIGNILRGREMTTATVPPGNWRFFAKAKDTTGNYSVNAFTLLATVVNTFTNILSRTYAPDWIGKDFAVESGSGLASGVPLVASSVSVAAWVNLDAFRNWTNVLANNWVNSGWLLYVDSAGLAYFGVGKASVQSNAQSNASIGASRWVRLIGTYDNATVKLYVNGVLQSITAAVAGAATDIAFALGVPSSLLAGERVDGIRIWNRALTAQEASDDFSNLDIPTGLIAAWDFSEGTGTSVQDMSGLGHNITLTGPTWIASRQTGRTVKHWTGVLTLDSKSLASDLGWEVFDQFVPNPVTRGFFEAPEIDKLVDAYARVWVDMVTLLGPGETGVADAQASIDYRLNAGVYDGFESWAIGTVNFRLIKSRAYMDSRVGNVVMSQYSFTIDNLERTEKAQNVAVLAGGTAITFTQPFHIPPNLQVTAQGGTARIAGHQGLTTTGATIRLFDNTGAGASGNADWSASGV